MQLLETSDGARLIAGPGERVVFLPGAKKVSPRPGGRRPVAVVLHYTAVRAANRKKEDLNLPAFRDHVDAGVRSFVAGVGHVPAGLALCLQNFASDRKASWDVLVGRDGTVYQCNLRPTTHMTWHAGRRAADMPKDEDLRWRGRLVWRASEKNFHHPVLPDGTVMQSGNDATIGIELECWGPIHFDEGAWRVGPRKRPPGKPRAEVARVDPAEVVNVGGIHYERISDAQHAALVSVATALRDAYSIDSRAWYRHAEIRPDTRSDPEPPLDVAALLARLYEAPESTAREIDADEDPALKAFHDRHTWEPAAVDGEPGVDET